MLSLTGIRYRNSILFPKQRLLIHQLISILLHLNLLTTFNVTCDLQRHASLILYSQKLIFIDLICLHLFSYTHLYLLYFTLNFVVWPILYLNRFHLCVYWLNNLVLSFFKRLLNVWHESLIIQDINVVVFVRFLIVLELFVFEKKLTQL